MFPGASIRDTLTSFRNRQSLPQIHLPQSFLRAAKRKKDPLSKLTCFEHLVNMYITFHFQMFLVDILENDTVEVVNVVMNNMENYLPSDVIKQDKV